MTLTTTALLQCHSLELCSQALQLSPGTAARPISSHVVPTAERHFTDAALHLEEVSLRQLSLYSRSCPQLSSKIVRVNHHLLPRLPPQPQGRDWLCARSVPLPRLSPSIQHPPPPLSPSFFSHAYPLLCHLSPSRRQRGDCSTKGGRENMEIIEK